MVSAKEAVFVDVDDTLVRSFGSKRIPMTNAVEKMRELHSAGCKLFLWSSGGGEYCLETARELGIEELFVAFLPKPRLMIDDMPIEKWEPIRFVHVNMALSFSPGELTGETAG